MTAPYSSDLALKALGVDRGTSRRFDHAFPFATAERILAKLYTVAVFRRRFAHLGTGTFISPYIQIQDMRFLSVGDSTGIHRATRILAFEHYASTIYTPRIVIGDRVHIGRGCTLSACNELSIGNDVTVGDNVYIADSQHGFEDPDRGVQLQPLTMGRVTIDRNAWIGYGAVIMGDVGIGEHAIVGANSVVTRSVPAFTVVAGAPARIIRRYDRQTMNWTRIAPDEREADTLPGQE